MSTLMRNCLTFKVIFKLFENGLKITLWMRVRYKISVCAMALTQSF